jgi:hypothetical protein
MRIQLTQAPRRRRAEGTAGFSLLEVAIYLLLLVMIGAPILAAVLTSSRATKENDAFCKVEERNRTVLTRLEREVRTCISGTPAVSNSGRTLTFTSAAGFSGTGPINGPVISFTFQTTSAESLNGADDDGNGLVDDGELVRNNLGTGESVTISGGIDLANTGFALSGSGVTISVGSFGSLDRRYGTYSALKSVTVYPRN